MASNAELLWLTVTTVARVMLIIAVGAAAQTRFSAAARSVRGMSYLSLHVFLPCLLFSNLSVNTSWDALAEFYWAPAFALMTTIIGFASSLLLRLFFAPEYVGILVLACTFQNGLTFPLGLVYSIHGLAWLTPRARQQCESYIFMYNIISSTSLFALGDMWIAYCSRKEAEQKARAAAAAAAAVASSSDANSAAGGGGADDVVDASAHAQLQWYRPASAGEGARVVVLSRHGTTSTAAASSSRRGGAWAVVKQASSSPPVASSLLGILVALTPPLRWLLSTPPGQMLLGAFSAIGEATLVMQLVILGASMARTQRSSTTTTTGGGDTTAAAPQQQQRHWWPRRVRVSQHTRLVLVTLVLRLVFIPMVCFGVLHLLRRAHLIPEERPFLFAMLLEFCAPSAVNATLMCLMHNYHENEVASLIFVMYLASIGTMACWLFVYVIYLGN